MERAAARWTWGLLGASLVLRLVIALPVLTQPVWPSWDEAGYLAQGRAWAAVLSSLAQGVAPEDLDLADAYGRGVWPPLQPFLIGLAMALFGSHLAVARLVPLVLSALTTPLVYRFGRQVAGEQAGRGAGLLHLLYPPFVGFSHLLWSETLFFLSLILAASALAGLPKLADARHRLLAAALAGVGVGLCGLARAAVLPFLILFPLWAALLGKGRERLRLAGAVALLSALTVAPWLIWLHQREGRFVLFSTAAGYNLLLGQTPAPDQDDGNRRNQKEALNREVRFLAQSLDLSQDEAARRLALETIREDPGAALGRAAGRARALLGADTHLGRHLLQAVYPPTAPWLAGGLWLLIQLSFLLVAVLVLRGLADSSWPLSHRLGLLVLAAAGAAPALLTVATPRMALPLLGLLLPAAGKGLEASKSRKGRWVLGGLFALGLVLTWAGSPPVGAVSSFHASTRQWLRTLTGDAGTENPALIGDRFALRASPEACAPLVVTGASERTVIVGGPLLFEARLTDPSATIELLVSCGSQRSGQLVPVNRRGWRSWQGTGLPGVEVMWLGGKDVTPTPLDPEWPPRRPVGGT
ncbi:MAG TPA: glycosyltransferase family 39 protein [Thermoanaerobaculia bacterium]|nr:glycosyltransferase family 39 protein [Thermoanaerobaculia bacterium]